jgi:hypothetical protein
MSGARQSELSLKVLVIAPRCLSTCIANILGHSYTVRVVTLSSDLQVVHTKSDTLLGSHYVASISNSYDCTGPALMTLWFSSGKDLSVPQLEHLVLILIFIMNRGSNPMSTISGLIMRAESPYSKTVKFSGSANARSRSQMSSFTD